MSDNSTQFTSEEFAAFCARHGIRHSRTSPGYSASNGQAERYVETVKSALNKGMADGGTINEVLNKFLFSYRSTPHATTQVSPAELFLKRQVRTVLDLLRPTATEARERTRTRYQRNFDLHTRDRQFQDGDSVIVRDFRHAQDKIKWTPGTLISRKGNRLWNVQVKQQIWRRHENQIKSRSWSDNDDVTVCESELIDNSISKQPAVAPQQSSQTKQQQQQPLRRSSRIRKPVKRLITEI